MRSVSLIVPCYDEEEVLGDTAHRLLILLDGLQRKGKIAPGSCVYFVDDGSQDGTWQLIEQMAAVHGNVRAIKLAHNRGHQNALLAGLCAADGDVLISVDADLQDDVGAIEPMLDAHAAGADIVYGVRNSRRRDTFFKRFTAELYYRSLRAMGVEVVFNHGDFRLMSRRTIEALREYGEVELFLRGIIPQLGFPSSIVYYDRTERRAGKSKYPLRKMVALGIQGITSFSAAPLRCITGLGIIISATSFSITLWALGLRLFTSVTVPGWASTVVPIYFLGGIQLLCLGIIGEYLAKVYMQTKQRPRYTVEKAIPGQSQRRLRSAPQTVDEGFAHLVGTR